MFFVYIVEGLEESNPWQIVFQNAKGVAPQSAHSRDKHQYAIAPSVAHVRFQLSRVGNCSSMIVSCDSWRRLMRSCVLVKTSVFTLDGGQATEPELGTEGAIFVAGVVAVQTFLNTTKICKYYCAVAGFN